LSYWRVVQFPSPEARWLPWKSRDSRFGFGMQLAARLDPESRHPESRLRYLMIFATTPAPTVRPPSRIAKRSPSSIAIGAIRLTTILMLSPGITISTPSGSSQAPVTSVVRK